MTQWIFLAIGLVGGIAVISLFRPKRRAEDNSAPLFKMLSDEMKDIRRTLDERMHQSNENLKYQSSESQKLIREITREITEVKETGKQVMNFTDQLQQLQNMLKNPKGRGILGEYYLETVLKNVMPPGSFQMQYAFPNGDIVDAAVFVKDRVIPIDSKFSLENYNRMIETKDTSTHEQYEREFKSDLKKRIDETSKYIRPDNGTMDFAFMFIPHEAIYYDLLVAEVGGIKINTHDLIEYAFKKNVLIVSPTSFLAFLQTVLQGLKALQIEESAKEIQKKVGELGNHLKAYADYHDKLGKNLGTVVNQYNLSNKEFKKIDKDVMRISGESMNIEVLEIDRPQSEE